MTCTPVLQLMMLVVLYICALWTLVNSAHLLAKRDDCYSYDGTKGWCSTPLYGCGYDEVGSGPDCPCRFFIACFDAWFLWSPNWWFSALRTALGFHAECCIRVKCTDSKANGPLDGFCSNGNCGEGRTKTFTDTAFDSQIRFELVIGNR